MAGFALVEKRGEVILVKGAMNRNRYGVWGGNRSGGGVKKAVGGTFEWVRWHQGPDLGLV